MTKVIRQTVKSKVAIIVWLVNNEQWIKDNRPTHQEVADKVGSHLGRKVSHSTIGDIARSGELPFEWPTPKASAANLVPTMRYAALVSKVKELEDRLAALEAGLGVQP